jgi:hypothetical protein
LNREVEQSRWIAAGHDRQVALAESFAAHRGDEGGQTVGMDRVLWLPEIGG